MLLTQRADRIAPLRLHLLEDILKPLNEILSRLKESTYGCCLLCTMTMLGSLVISAAKSVSGVKTVDARLQADARLQSAGQLAKDFALASAVKGNIAAQAGINALAVDVVANRGTVVVSGTVHSAPLKSTVVAAAKSTNGVQRLIDEIRVAQ